MQPGRVLERLSIEVSLPRLSLLERLDMKARSSRLGLPVGLIATLVLIASLSPVAEAAAPKPASVRLFTASKKVTLDRFGKRVYLDLGAWIAPVGGDLEFRVSRPDYDSPVALSQVEPGSGTVLRTLPSEMLNDWNGLRDFVKVTLTDEAGQIIEAPPASFCPNSYERQRLNDEGPIAPRYPQFCGSYAPFTLGMVWGIDEHWAVALAGGYEGDGMPSVRIPAGEYTATVSIAPEYVDALEVAAEHATASVDVTVVQRERRGCCRHHRSGSTEHENHRPTEGVPTETDPDPRSLPDLVALPLWSIWTEARPKKDLLTFAATPWNAGPAPLWVEGFRRSDESLMDAYQYFTNEDGEVTGRAPVGELEYDERRGHNHWHFLQFARYTLLDQTGEEVVASKKQSFCIAPTDAIDLTVPGANWEGWSPDLFTQCGGRSSLWVREVMEPGWGDTYYQSVAGQAFNITNVPNGWYTLVSEVDPGDRLYQSDQTNDVETRLVYLGGKPGARRVKAAPWHGMNP